jgi:hypothetical protein
MPKKGPTKKRRLTPDQRINELLFHWQRATTTEGKSRVHQQLQLVRDAAQRNRAIRNREHLLMQKERLMKEIEQRRRNGLLPEREQPPRLSKEVQKQIAQAAEGLDSENLGKAWNALQKAEKIAKTVPEKKIIAERWFDLAVLALAYESSFAHLHLDGALAAARKANDQKLVLKLQQLAARNGYRLK